LLSLIEAERRQLAQELHDETAQILTATLFQIDSCVAALGPEQRALGMQLRSIRETLGAATRDIHRLVYSLSPPVLAEMGLGPALRWLVGTFQTHYQMSVTLKAPELDRLPKVLEAALFRIVQEALTNVARHAQARSVRIELRLTQHAVSCSIRDDGRGFDLQTVLEPEKARLGLMGMRERAGQFGGAITISSGLGMGTTVHVTIPLGEMGSAQHTGDARRRSQDPAQWHQSAVSVGV
jgi:two-component system sensor histidine kinase UhpB